MAQVKPTSIAAIVLFAVVLVYIFNYFTGIIDYAINTVETYSQQSPPPSSSKTLSTVYNALLSIGVWLARLLTNDNFVALVLAIELILLGYELTR